MENLNIKVAEVSMDQFVELVKDHIMDYLSGMYQHLKPEVKLVLKTNETLFGLYLIPSDETPSGEADATKLEMLPVLYLNDFYKSMAYEDVSSVIQAIAASMKLQLNNRPEMSINYENAAENIVVELVNTETNAEMLEKVPHRAYHDLSIIYRWIIDPKMVASAIITNELALRLNLDESKLYDLAIENTKRIMKPNIRPIYEVMAELTGLSADTFKKESEPEMWIGTNEFRLFGATTILFEDMLQELSEQLESEFYIIPSSINEILLLPADGVDVDFISALVKETNMNEVKLEERLSNSVYFYSKNVGVCIAKITTESICGGGYSHAPGNMDV